LDTNAMLDAIERLLEKSGIAVLATVDGEGRPHMRWMTPAVVRGRTGFLYAVTSPEFRKVVQTSGNPNVEWMIQTRALDEVVTVRGEMQVVDNPAAKAEVLEAIGGRLGVFWKLNPDESKLVVLETQIGEAVHFRPTKGERTAVSFGGGDE
jgi:general stress protein 26